jgi:GNAT superfamily N-acetyltransferase
MNLTGLNLRALDGPNARAYGALYNAIRAERIPAEPPLVPEAVINLWQTVPSFVEVHAWAAWEATVMIGAGAALLSRYEQNTHLVVGDLMVLPEARRRRVGTALLREIVAVGLREGRSVIQLTSRVPDGERFAEAIGASIGMHSVTSELQVAAVDETALTRWAAAGPAHDGRFRLLRVHGGCDDNVLPLAAKAWHLLNDAPSDDLSYDADLLTPAQLREFDQRRAAAGVDQLMLLVEDTRSPDPVGFAHFTCDMNGTGGVVSQDGLAIAPHVRGQGLARWLEASALLTVLRTWPRARAVRTNQAKSNAAALSVLHGVGFAPVQDFIEWEAKLDLLARQLA